MPANRQYGMDNEYYDWNPIVARKPLRWPRQARVALSVVVVLEHLEWNPPSDAFQLANVAGGRGSRPFPNYVRFGHREYGHRVGVFRLLEALHRRNILASVAMDAMTADHYPFLVRHCLDLGCEIVAHGISASRLITSRMSADEERKYIAESIGAIARATAEAPSGWMGPEFAESFRTPQLLAESGLQYVCDWTNDDQPYRMNTSAGEIISIPSLLDFNDVNALWDRRLSVDDYVKLLRRGFDTLYRDGKRRGRMMILVLHPWLMGQPFRIGALEELLDHFARRTAVWPAQLRDIAQWYKDHEADKISGGNDRAKVSPPL